MTDGALNLAVMCYLSMVGCTCNPATNSCCITEEFDLFLGSTFPQCLLLAIRVQFVSKGLLCNGNLCKVCGSSDCCPMTAKRYNVVVAGAAARGGGVC